MIMIDSSEYSDDKEILPKKHKKMVDQQRHMTTSFGIVAKDKEQFELYKQQRAKKRMKRLEKKKQAERDKNSKILINTDYTSINQSMMKVRKGRTRMQTLNKPGDFVQRAFKENLHSGKFANSTRVGDLLDGDMTMLDTPNNAMESGNDKIESFTGINAGFIPEERKSANKIEISKLQKLDEMESTSFKRTLPPLKDANKPKYTSNFQDLSLYKTNHEQLDEEDVEESPRKEKDAFNLPAMQK